MKNFKIGKRLLSIFLASSISLTLGGCHGKVDMSKISFEDLMSIDEVKNSTLLDELSEDEVYLDDYLRDADLLERYMDIVDLLSDVDFKDVDKLRPLNDLEYSTVSNMSMSEIAEVKALALNKSNNLVDLDNKLYALKKLNYINNYCKDWIKANGKNVSINVMLNSVKAGVGDFFNVPLDEYKFISIPALTFLTSDDVSSYQIYVNGEMYEIDNDAHDVNNTLEYIYLMQTSNISEDKEYDSYRKALNFAKTTLASGVSLKNGMITSKNDSNYIEDNYVKTK